MLEPNTSAPGSISFREVANEFRDYLRQVVASPSSIAKGAFVAMAGEESECRGEGKGGQEKKKPSRRRKHKKQGLKGAVHRQTCYGCGGFHRLTKCFYAFPQQAPQDWRPRKEIMEKYKEELRTNTKLQEQVKKLEIIKKQSDTKDAKEESH